MAFDQIFNLFEGLLWTGIALVCFFRVRRSPHNRDLLTGAGVTFLLFGITDFVEIRTRAWFDPWPLLAVNVLCVSMLLFLLILYRKRKATGTPPDQTRD